VSLWLSLLGGCSETPLLKNSTIDHWCGDHPCHWDVSGDIARVGSWHPDDYAVQLISDDAAISQLNADVDARDSRCFDFTLVAKIGRGAHATLELDFMADGSSEFVQELPASDWDRLTFKITAPDWYEGVRFIARKHGPGEVILAELAAGEAYDACTAPPVELDDRPTGAPCTRDAQCANGQCEGSICGGCTVAGASCDAGMVCGRVRMLNGIVHACVPEASGEFGSVCEDGRQCQNGHCQDHACSECDGKTCDDGRACSVARPFTTPHESWPSVCDAGRGTRASGETCTDDSDCASHDCDEGDMICGRPCASIGDPSCRVCATPQVQPGRCR
jgi:hypothetical protein